MAKAAAKAKNTTGTIAQVLGTVVFHFEVVAPQLRDQVFGIDQILRTAQGDDVHLIASRRSRFHGFF